MKYQADPSTGPLAGIRVLDLSSVVLGPFATMALGDLGAEIIKVESPEGDSARWVSSGRNPGMSGTHMNLNRNKRSIALDLRMRTAQQAVLRLAASADALFHNMRPKAITRLGLDYDAVRRVRPAIVYCVCTGYDSRGPFGGLPAYDDLIQGASGLADLVGRAGDGPAFVPMALCDKVVGLTAAYALTAALLHRERTGEGQHIEVPMHETMVSFVAAEHLGDSLFEPPGEKFGYARILSPNRRPHRTMDGHLCVLAYTDRQWRAFFRIAGRDESLQDPRFSTLAARTRNTDTLYEIVAEEIAKRTTAEWLALLQQAEIPAMPVLSLDDLRENPQLRESEFLTIRTHPSEGRYLSLGVATQFSATPCAVTREPPRLGDHGAEILREAGYGDAEIQAMRACGALVEAGRAD